MISRTDPVIPGDEAYESAPSPNDIGCRNVYYCRSYQVSSLLYFLLWQASPCVAERMITFLPF